MSFSMIAILRAIHIAFGAFWLGGLIVAGFFLLPMTKVTGVPGDQDAVRLIVRTRLLAALTAAGVVSVLAGVLLYHCIWAGVGHIGPARWYSTGGYSAIAAIILTGGVSLPAANKLATLVRTQGGRGSSPPTPVPHDRQAQLISRLTWGTRLSAALLTVTIVLMAMGRYLA